MGQEAGLDCQINQGSRVVIDKNVSGTNSINSPVNTNVGETALDSPHAAGI